MSAPAESSSNGFKEFQAVLEMWMSSIAQDKYPPASVLVSSYSDVFRLCGLYGEDKLYDIYQQTLVNYLGNMLSRLQAHASSANLLEEWVNEVRKAKSAIRFLAKVFMFLENFYTRNNNVVPLKEIAFLLFNQHIVNRFGSTITDAITSTRENQSAVVVKSSELIFDEFKSFHVFQISLEQWNPTPISKAEADMLSSSYWPTSIDSYHVGQQKGTGSFGNVFESKVLTDPTGRKCALKILHQNDADTKQKIMEEYTALLKCASPFVVKPLALFQYQDSKWGQKWCLVTELCDQDLKKYLKAMKESNTKFGVGQIALLFASSVASIFSIHRADMMHRDLKLDNFLVKTDIIKVADLGLSKETFSATTEQSTVKGNNKYRAPEKISGKLYGKKADVFALGCILYELCTFEFPYVLNDATIDSDKINRKYSTLSGDFVGFNPLLHMCLEPDREKRASIYHLMLHETIQSALQQLATNGTVSKEWLEEATQTCIQKVQGKTDNV